MKAFQRLSCNTLCTNRIHGYQTRALCSVQYHRKRMDEIGQELGVQQLDDWYKLSRAQVRLKAPFVVTHYKSLFATLRAVYPEHNWIPSKLYLTTSLDLQRQRMDEIGLELGVKKLDDWYEVSRRSIRDRAPFIQEKYGSVLEALKTIYPEHQWNEHRYIAVKQRKKLEAVGAKLGVKELDDWYKVFRSKAALRIPFIQTHYGNMYKTLCALYPNHEWDETRFFGTHKYGKNELNRKKKLEEVGLQLGVKELDDWYNVSRTSVHSKASFIRKYYGSLLNTLKSVYPNHPWNELRFKRIISWNEAEDKMINFVNEMVGKHGIKSHHDWSRLQHKDLNVVKRFAVSRFKSVSSMMQTLFPTSTQYNLLSKPEASLEEMLKLFTVVEPQARIGGHSIDLFLPEWKVAVEYQGCQHYKQTHHGVLTEQMERDQRKRIDLTRLGIHVIQIPFWWNNSWTHLQMTLNTIKNST